MKHILGIDVSKDKLDLALRLPDGKARHKVVTNDPEGFAALRAFLTKQGTAELHACMEATGIYWEAIAEYLADAGFTVSVVNPAQIKAFGHSRLQRTKTDKVDAGLIADFCAAQAPSPWQPPGPALRELRSLVARRQALDTMRTQEKNRLGVAREAVRTGIAEHLDYLDQAIAEIDRMILLASITSSCGAGASGRNFRARRSVVSESRPRVRCKHPPSLHLLLSLSGKA